MQRPEFLPESGMDREEMTRIQNKIGQEADFSDSSEFNDLEDKAIVGIDQAFLNDKAVSGAVVMQNGEVIEKQHALADAEIPYIPGLLAFREAPAIVKALEKISVNPDILVLDGSGRIHFRQAGIATHIGVLHDTPSIGVAKKLLCGKPEESLDQELQEGRCVRILSDNRMNLENGQTVGHAYQSRQYSSPNRKINPLFVSSGHGVSAETSVDVVSKLCEGYKLPEPTRRADKYVDEVKRELRKS